jgi:hypothetical protein
MKRESNFIRIESDGVRVPLNILGLNITTDDLDEPKDESEPSHSEDPWWCNLLQTDWAEITGLSFDFKSKDRELAFPWAVFGVGTAKSPEVLSQVAFGAELALRMLNDLALEPGPPNIRRPYQTPTSDSFQIYAFTLVGPVWKVYNCKLVREHCGKDYVLRTLETPLFVSFNLATLFS